MPKLEKVLDGLVNQLYKELDMQILQTLGKENIKEQIYLLISFVKSENIDTKIDKLSTDYTKSKINPVLFKEINDNFTKLLKKVGNLSFAELEAWKEIYNFVTNIIVSKVKYNLEKKLKEV